MYFSRARVVCAQYHVKSEYYRRQARSAVVVVGELGVHLHLHHTFRTAHGHVLIRVDHHHTQVEVHQAKTATKHTGQHGKTVNKKIHNKYPPDPLN